MSNVSNVKTTAFIGTTKEASAEADFTSDTWTSLGSPTDFGEFGDSAETIKFNVIGEGRVRKLKGVRDAGTVDITFAFDADDAGQNAFRAAEQSEDKFNFKIALADGTTYFLRGLVESFKNTLKDASSVVQTTFTVALDQAPLMVKAA